MSEGDARHESAIGRKRIPEDYPGTAQSDRGEAVTDLETKSLDGAECLVRVWTEDREEPIELAMTPTQVRQWEAQFNIERWRVDIRRTREKPTLDDTVLVSTLGKSFHDPHADACAAVNAHDTAIEKEKTVAEAVDEGKRPCRHCWDYDEVDPDELIQETRIHARE